jgi:hypothetical protein
MEYIVINYDNCNKTHKISLETKNTDEWDETKIKSMLIKPETISSIIVGPKTVVEIFAGPNLDTQSYKIINDSKDQTKSYKFFDCPKDNNKWFVSLKSFKIWTYDYYDSIYGIRYCDSDKMCDENELCMCPSGKTDPLWCPQSKKRCMNEKYYYDPSGIPINNEDTINTQCLKNQLNDDKINFADLQTKFRPCMTDKLKVIENFSTNSNYGSIINIVIYILIAIIIIMLIKKYYQ